MVFFPVCIYFGIYALCMYFEQLRCVCWHTLNVLSENVTFTSCRSVSLVLGFFFFFLSAQRFRCSKVVNKEYCVSFANSVLYL